jgi:di/tricarboxylate transporter
MNNVGALALLLPVALQISARKQIPISAMLMPLAFASLLGGMTTLIGTPPNIIISSFREQAGGEPFRMFDFSMVGVGVALAGILFVALIGWRLIPCRRKNESEPHLFEIEKYFTEVQVPEASSLVDIRLRDVNPLLKTMVNIVGLVRGSERRLEPSSMMKIRKDDILVVAADTEDLQTLVSRSGALLVGSKQIERSDLESDEVRLLEAVIAPGSVLVGGTAFSLNLRSQYGVNLLAVARQGTNLWTRLDRIRLRTGDVLLLQSHVETLKEVLSALGCLPLADRDLRLGRTHSMLISLAIFLVALLSATLGILPVQIAFVAGAVGMVIAGLITLQQAYNAVDWPIIVLLGAMIPVGSALETTGAAQKIAGLLLQNGSALPAGLTIALVLVTTMFLSDLVNNAAAVVLMAPVGIGIANGLGASVDPFLIAIAIGASCAFLTPIGHQSNTLVMGPGGYKFGDYWRMGIILELIVAAIAIPLILYFWPL